MAHRDRHRAAPRPRVCVRRREDPGRRRDDEPRAPDRCSCRAPVMRQSTIVPTGSTVPDSKSSLRKQIESDIMCTCGCRVAMATCPMGPSCHGLQTLGPKIDELTAKGMTREQVRDALVAEHGGQDILLAPIDKGFNRLAWLFPYAIGVVGAVASSSSPSDGRVTMRRSRSRIPQRRTSLSREGSMTSSVTSTSGDVRLKPDTTSVGDVRLQSDKSSTFRPSHFFVLASLMAATAAVVMSRQSTPEHLCSSASQSPPLVSPRRLLPVLSPLVGDAARPTGEALSERVRAVLTREKGTGAAIAEGSRVRSIDGEGVPVGLRRDGSAPSRAGVVADEAARRRREWLQDHHRAGVEARLAGAPPAVRARCCARRPRTDVHVAPGLRLRHCQRYRCGLLQAMRDEAARSRLKS